MPHVTVKAKLAEDIAKAVMANANCGEDSVSVSIEDIEPGDWVDAVYKPDILGKWDKLFKKPGYDPLK